MERAPASVESAGENNAACEKATSWAGVAEPIAALAEAGADDGAPGRLKCQSCVARVRQPCSMGLFWSNHDTGCIERNRAAGIAKWTKSEQRVGAEVRNNVNLVGFWRQSWEI